MHDRCVLVRSDFIFLRYRGEVWLARRRPGVFVGYGVEMAFVWGEGRRGHGGRGRVGPGGKSKAMFVPFLFRCTLCVVDEKSHLQTNHRCVALASLILPCRVERLM